MRAVSAYQGQQATCVVTFESIFADAATTSTVRKAAPFVYSNEHPNGLYVADLEQWIDLSSIYWGPNVNYAFNVQPSNTTNALPRALTPQQITVSFDQNWPSGDTVLQIAFSQSSVA